MEAPLENDLWLGENVMSAERFSDYLETLANRMQAREPETFKEFARLFGPAFRDWFLRQGIVGDEAESLSVRSIGDAAAKLTTGPAREASQVEDALVETLHSTLAARLIYLQAIRADLDSAAILQAQLLRVDPPLISGLDIAVRFRAARVITGDLVDLVDWSDDSTLLVLGDASGKGAAAALYSALLLGCLRAKARRDMPLPELMTALNDLLSETGVVSRYVTLIAALWDKKERRMRFSCAGAVSPVLLRGGEAAFLKMEGFPLGMYHGKEYELESIEIQHGETVVLLSDGVTDQEGSTSEIYGEQRLLELVAQSSSWSSAELADRLLGDVEAFAQGTPASDDQTVVVIRRKE